MGISVLVVDDDDDIADLLLAGLDRAGISAARAKDGDECVDGVRREHPMLVLLDWMMPGKDGIEACREIRSDPDLSQPYILMLTARARDEDQKFALTMGVDEVIAKPFRPREVVARVRSLLPEEQIS